MADFYDEMQEFASEMLGEFKQGIVTLTRTVTTPADPSTPWIPGEPVTTVYPLDAIVKRLHQRYEGGVLIIETGDMVTFAVPAVVPALTDQLVIDGVERAITDLTPIPAAGQPVAWKAWCAA
ncbi:MAG: hypothetical protein E5X53_26300 [Mesorhizobium sp.]|uniref:hypothetical protein n=1 Tax=Mesorhizobium sp. TaxID=1871066 RepID=UPI0011F9BC19|nr:hypothetical protein [Mesorhizobium sp.]TIP70577.1 MAG: hypothetical protein E5X55_26550 [Mesorhizobium sp.]TIQ06767.1 MAG: hypothetical protein E5X57_24260 [Mesorhizobium sp.]TIR49011.1 MAG: hypothetical protein E5X53_26300 [Mesorhizobium sp.]TJV94846.1 MAG: hypothetical protein E5X52_26825 [Mesorhizobium sp.]